MNIKTLKGSAVIATLIGAQMVNGQDIQEDRRDILIDSAKEIVLSIDRHSDSPEEVARKLEAIEALLRKSIEMGTLDESVDCEIAD